MRVLLSGATGLVGAALKQRLPQGGHQVCCLVRRAAEGVEEIAWDPQAGWIDRSKLEAAGIEAVVHLAGESIAAGRWNAARKERIVQSRVQGTRLVAETLAALPDRPRVLACASAIGWYGDRGDETLDESSPPGKGFLAEVCRDWEAAAAPAAAAGVRVVVFRLGMVLDGQRGALAKMLPLFRYGLGGRLGSGRQYVSWVTLDDATRAVTALLDEMPLAGPVNLVAPQSVRQRQFASALGRALHRPARLPTPRILLRLALGQMADELLLASARVVPRRLEEAGFVFRQATLEGALSHVLR